VLILVRNGKIVTYDSIGFQVRRSNAALLVVFHW
jgi:hypothetical protein